MQKTNVWLATSLLNHRVRNAAGEDLGKIEDVVIDPDTGNVQFAILSFGGVLGMGEKLFPIPRSALRIAPAGDYFLLDIDKETLKRAPGYERNALPNMADPAWRREIHGYYGHEYSPDYVRPDYERERPVLTERRVILDRERERPRRGLGLVGGILLVCLVMGLAWMTYLVATRGWDQAKEDVRSSLQSAAYAAKETSRDAAVTAKVKTALSLSKRIPADKIDVDSEGDVVTMRGEVPSEQVRTLAESIASDVPGVSEVRNHLFVLSQSQ